MKHRRIPTWGGLILLSLLTLTSTAARAGQKTMPERWLHVRVEHQDAKGEMVRINLPISLAEKVLPTINNERLRKGRVRIEEAKVSGVDLRALLDALRTSKDGEYVTVQGTEGDVRIFKKNGYFEAYVHRKGEDANSEVEIRVPLKVVEALLSAGNHELDVVAALRVLSTQGDMELVTVKDRKSTVRVWLDSKNTD